MPKEAKVLDPTGFLFLGVDITEYYGGENFQDANNVISSQLKYSTRNANKNWTINSITKTNKNKKDPFSGSIIDRLSSIFSTYLSAYDRDIVLQKVTPFTGCLQNYTYYYEYRNIPDYANISNIYFSNQYLFITYGFERRVRFILVNRNTTKMENGSFLENDLDYISFANPTPININDNRIYFNKDAGEIVHQKKDGVHVHKTINNLL